MSKELIMNAMSLAIGLVSMAIIYYYGNLMLLIGIFLLLWSNNINLSNQICKTNKKDMNYIRQLIDKIFGENFADLDEKMSRNMRISDK